MKIELSGREVDGRVLHVDELDLHLSARRERWQGFLEERPNLVSWAESKLGLSLVTVCGRREGGREGGPKTEDLRPASRDVLQQGWANYGPGGPVHPVNTPNLGPKVCPPL